MIFKIASCLFLFSLIACDHQENLRWHQLKEQNQLIAIDSYLVEFPDGKFIDEASELKEKLSWQVAVYQNTEYGYQKYKHKYPQGIYHNQLQERLAKIPKDPVELLDLSKGTFVGKIIYEESAHNILAFKFKKIIQDSNTVRFLASFNVMNRKKELEGSLDLETNLINFNEKQDDPDFLNICEGRIYVDSVKILIESTKIHQYWNLIKYKD